MKTRPKTKLWQWQQKKHGDCDKCGKEAMLNVEHIIPVSFLEQIGQDEARYEDEENFAHYCFPCNRFKGSRIDLSHPKTVYLLKKYVNLLSK